MAEGVEGARHKVQAPALFLLVAGALDGLASVAVIVLGFGVVTLEGGKHFFNLGPAEGVIGVVSLLISVLICVSALRMRNLRSFRLALTGSVLALVPCCGGVCWPLSLPAGVWALVVLNNAEVKAAFR